MSPLGLAVFFTFMTLAEGGGKKALKHKFGEVSSTANLIIKKIDSRFVGLSSCLEGELLRLACRTNHQFQVYAVVSPTSVCKYSRRVLVRVLIPLSAH